MPLPPLITAVAVKVAGAEPEQMIWSLPTALFAISGFTFTVMVAAGLSQPDALVWVT